MKILQFPKSPMDRLGQQYADQVIAGAKLHVVALLGEGPCRFSKLHFILRERRQHVPMSLFVRAIEQLLKEKIVRTVHPFSLGTLCAEIELELGSDDDRIIPENPFHESA